MSSLDKVRFGAYCAGAAVTSAGHHCRRQARLARKLLGLLCLAYIGANALSKLSLNFVTISTMIVFKSCKLVFVMEEQGYSWQGILIVRVLDRREPGYRHDIIFTRRIER